MTDHPAALAHWQGIGIHNGVDEKNFIPNHAELLPYFKQLPTDQKYVVLDTEADISEKDAEEYDVWLKGLTGFDVQWSDDRGYGGCQMIIHPVTGQRGIHVYVNGSPWQSAPSYLVVPELVQP